MTTSDNYGQGSSHNFKKELEEFFKPQIELQTRLDMSREPSHEVVDKEIQYRLAQEKSALNKMSEAEAEVAYKSGIKASEYVTSRDN